MTTCNNNKIQYRHKRIGYLTPAILLMLLLTFMSGCSLEDERDVCCGLTILNYRYVRHTKDEYKEFVQQMRHFLFDKNGIYVREVKQSESNPQKLVLKNIKPGDYTMLTVGNMTPNHTALSALVEGNTTLSDMELTLAKELSSPYPNGDQLFWNTRHFNASNLKRQEYMCDLANIHCHLFVRVSWEDLPEQEGDYTMLINNVEQKYYLNPTRQDSIKITNEVTHTFPRHANELVTHSIVVPMKGLELNGEFITLRYKDDKIPLFQLFKDGTAITKVIDLAPIFQTWGWFPNKHPEQIYKIHIQVKKSGGVVIRQEIDGSVIDWEDGGSIHI